ncbi:hypothetical protein [Inhella proteolytica]|uniref:DUF4424 domain-containing protein n=1 Tax=Inhella proteolytica TaxID=2795029 RepID=A0A931J8R1_9BURK|nr:hypothetical protein [Inhella proteolytica]MBH9578862.1 hypothetical protein [Inhella proteolytica]
MTRRIETVWLLLAILTGLPSAAPAQEPSARFALNGQFSLEQTADIEDEKNPAKPLPIRSWLVQNNRAKVSANCELEFKEQPYYPGAPFQLLLKSGLKIAEIERFLAKRFNFKLGESPRYFDVEASPMCPYVASSLLLANGKAVMVGASSVFHGLKWVEVAAGGSAPAPDLLLGLQVTQLPFSPAQFAENCEQKIRLVKGVPKAPASCAPRFWAYTATRGSREPLAKLVGSHDYPKWGGRNESGDYANPVQNGLHPVFLVFRAHPGMWVLRVEDLEGRGEARDPMSGVYLVVKDGVVTDQLNEGCELDVQLVCCNSRYEPPYTLLPSGKFTR